jgi:YHS domain-containing protein
MKNMTKLVALFLALLFAASPFTVLAADKKDAKAKPYPLKTCIVSDEKLGEMGDPFVFVQDGQEFKLCCKSCQKDFNKAPQKYVKKLAAAQAKEKK